jgi:hypothetical protein
MMRTPRPDPLVRRAAREDGSAIIMALMTMMLLTALGLALVLATSAETMIAANYSSGQEALYAADAGMERAVLELPGIADLDALLQGQVASVFRDGVPGERRLPNGTNVDLVALTNVANCGTSAGCTLDQMNATTAERPWGANNPRWQLFAYGPVNDLLPAGVLNSPFYVVVWVGDDPAETDDDPTRDDALAANAPGRGVVVVRAEAFGPFGSHKRVEMTVQRPTPGSPDTSYTAQRGQDEQNRRNRTQVIQTPGGTLSRSQMNAATGDTVVK